MLYSWSCIQTGGKPPEPGIRQSCRESWSLPIFRISEPVTAVRLCLGVAEGGSFGKKKIVRLWQLAALTLLLKICSQNSPAPPGTVSLTRAAKLTAIHSLAHAFPPAGMLLAPLHPGQSALKLLSLSYWALVGWGWNLRPTLCKAICCSPMKAVLVHNCTPQHRIIES